MAREQEKKSNAKKSPVFDVALSINGKEKERTKKKHNGFNFFEEQTQGNSLEKSLITAL